MTTGLEGLIEGSDFSAAGRAMHGLATELFPICRSITGEGVRETLRRLQRELPLEIHEVHTGTPVFDWVVPKEWNVREAWIRDPQGRKVVDFARCNLHLLNYSQPVRGRLPLSKLREHLHTLPDLPDAIPYKTSYFRETWGFCLSHAQLEALPDGEYEYCIDSSLEEGSLTYGEVFLPGRRREEILFSAHICHPSLANDNLSGIAVLHQLARALQEIDRAWSYRFVFAPGTIGAITWLARNQERLMGIRCGLVIAGVGDSGDFTYKRSRAGDAEIDLLVERVLRQSGRPYRCVDFTPDGYDERQYNSPGIGLSVGRLSRSPYAAYREYHTSGDDLDFIKSDSLAGALQILLRLCVLLESSPRYRNLSPRGEPQLGRRGLYSASSGQRDLDQRERAMFWVLNYSDGEHCIADIAERSGLSPELLHDVARLLEENELLEGQREAEGPCECHAGGVGAASASGWVGCSASSEEQLVDSSTASAETALHLRVGELVEVRKAEHILATLDAKGELDGLPFMPEMLRFCGRRLRVHRTAHKTCDTITGQVVGRRMEHCVHLEGVRCDGSAHGGCQADCLVFWKEAWLERVEAERGGALWRFISGSSAGARGPSRSAGGCSAEDLKRRAVRAGSAETPDAVYRCQVTQLLDATRPLAWWEPGQYVRDWLSGNWSLGPMLRSVLLRLLYLFAQLWGGRRVKIRVYMAVAALLGEPAWPYAEGTLRGGTPAVMLGLRPGDLVQVKSHPEILATLNGRKNRGMDFAPEMVRYCGGSYRVRSRVERLIDEKTGKMMRMNNDCIILDQVVCRSECSAKRLFCPRSIYPFWREIWLRRLAGDSDSQRPDTRDAVLDRSQ